MDNNHNSLKQYLELYDAASDTIDRHTPHLLNVPRAAACATLEESRLPDRHTEGYERTSINDMFAPDFGININRLEMQADLRSTFRCGVPNITPLTGVIVNDIFHPVDGVSERIPDGMFFGSLARACREIPDVIDRYYGSVAPSENPCVALNTLLAQDGLMVYVPAGINLDKPLQTVNILSASLPLMAVRRTLIIVEENASLSMLCCDHTASPGVKFAVSHVSEIILGQGASLDMCDMEEASPETARHSMTYISQAEDSRLTFNGITLQGGITRNEYVVNIQGGHCETDLHGMAVGCDSQHIDNSSTVRHNCGNSHSRQLFKYVLDDRSSGAFEGSIVVADGATFTEAYQSNRNILASSGARMHTRPQLEIYNDDVKCSHGTSTGQLDSEALFYMRTRGIPEHQARTMLMQAFMTDVIDSITIPGLRERLRHLVEMRFLRNEAHCAECSVSESTSACYEQ